MTLQEQQDQISQVFQLLLNENNTKIVFSIVSNNEESNPNAIPVAIKNNEKYYILSNHYLKNDPFTKEIIRVWLKSELNQSKKLNSSIEKINFETKPQSFFNNFYEKIMKNESN